MDLDVGPSGHPSINAGETYPGGDAYVSQDGNPSSAVDYDADVPFTATFEPGSSWVAISPASGSVTSGTSAPLDVTFDATGLADGTYTADLVITTNDPENPSVTVPLTLTVGAPTMAYDLEATATSPLTVAPGGEVSFSYTVTNTTDAPYTGDLYYVAEKPNGTPVRKGRIRSGTLPGGVSVSGTFTQQVPSNAPADTYTYRLVFGAYSDVTEDEEVFLSSRSLRRRPRASARDGTEAGADASAWAVVAASEWTLTGEAASRGAALAAEALPEAVALLAPYPNPARGRATLTVELPAATEVRLAVYDGLGREVAVLAEGPLAAGAHVVAFDGSGLPSGVYLVRLTAGGVVATHRLTLLR